MHVWAALKTLRVNVPSDTFALHVQKEHSLGVNVLRSCHCPDTVGWVTGIV